MAKERTEALLEKELAGWSGVDWEYDRAHRHPRLIVRTASGQRFHTFSNTPVEGRGMKNSIAMLRRTLRELGAEKV